MAYDKAVDSTALETGLTTIADAIRAKGGTDAFLEFPQGMADAVMAISVGGTPANGPRLISDTTYIHPEDWFTDVKGNGANVAKTYLNSDDLSDRDLYHITASGNTASSQRFDGGMYKHADKAPAYWGGFFRDGETGSGRAWSLDFGCRISRGTKIRVLRFSTEEAK